MASKCILKFEKTSTLSEEIRTSFLSLSKFHVNLRP